ncbi:hypothetical protein MRB53_027248 [Persea americana]|uniref:Uncharacterized protein n=1 Tax=Persea americana TaxID=3435 RepID=A0ACC2LKC3_PERAE|nr:hypothetical protein MRB53_027248 [Persea americana]
MRKTTEEKEKPMKISRLFLCWRRILFVVRKRKALSVLAPDFPFGHKWEKTHVPGLLPRIYNRGEGGQDAPAGLGEPPSLPGQTLYGQETRLTGYRPQPATNKAEA